MKKIDIKTKEIYSKDEMKRYLGALAEDFTGKVKGLSDGLKLVLEKQDEQTKILDSHTEMIGILLEDVSVLKDDASILKKDVSILKDDMHIVKGELKKKVDYDEFLSLVQRVNKLESRN